MAEREQLEEMLRKARGVVEAQVAEIERLQQLVAAKTGLIVSLRQQVSQMLAEQSTGECDVDG